MTDHSDLAKALAFAADVSQKTSALIDDALAKLSALKSALEQTHPQLTGIHKAIITATPATEIPAPVEEPKPEEEPEEEPAEETEGDNRPRDEHGRFV